MRRWCAIAGIFIGGCAATTTPDGQRPPDFALAVSTLGEPGTTTEPAWYVVDPDGSLRVGLGERRLRSPAPRTVRVLTYDERESLWRLVRDGSVYEEWRAGSPLGEQTIPQSESAVVFLAVDHRRRSVRIDDAAQNADFLALVERLRTLAWLEP